MGNDSFQLMGTCLDGKFQVEKFVAEGGFAVVYSGQHLSLDRAIAIKVLKTPVELNERARQEFISKFRLEGRTIARLSHLNIVQVLDFGVSRMPSGDTAPWMVLEWLTGRSLEQELSGRRGLGGRRPEEALSLLEPIFDALAYAHEEGIAHRDVKPANIMIVPTKRGEMLKLLDFGIVKIMEKGEIADTNLAPTRGVLSAHSPAYAAPEQITGLRTGPWTDVHALALLLTEVMTDLPPYDGKNITTLLREILSPQRPTPARHRIDAGPWESVLGRALALEPAERFKNASEFLAALKSAIPATLKPVAAEPGSTGEYVRTQILPTPASTARAERPSQREPKIPPSKGPGSQPSRRGKWLAAGAAVVVLALGVGALALRMSTGDKPPPRPEAARTPEASRPAAPASPRSPERSLPGEATATTAAREPPPSPPPAAEATPPERSATEASRIPAPLVETKRAEPRRPLPPPPPSSVAVTRTEKPGSVGQDAGFASPPDMKGSTGQQSGAAGRPRSPEKKPLQRTKIDLE